LYSTFNPVSLANTKLATPKRKAHRHNQIMHSHSLKQSTLYLARRCKSNRILPSVSSKYLFENNIKRYYKFPLFIRIYIFRQKLRKYNTEESINNSCKRTNKISEEAANSMMYNSLKYSIQKNIPKIYLIFRIFAEMKTKF
jgi:hypothetical protein